MQDFGTRAAYGMFFGAVYAIGGLLIVWFAFIMDYPLYSLISSIVGFVRLIRAVWRSGEL